MNITIPREKAWELILKYNQDQADLNHYLESEAVMTELANRLGEDPIYYGHLGLLHDIDWGLTKHDCREHLTKTQEILNGAGYDEQFIKVIISHGYGFDCAGLQNEKRNQKDEFALAASETVTGLVYAYALMRGGKVSDMEVAGLKKRFKDKRFAAAIRREVIMECEKLGLTLDKFLGIAISGIKKIASQVGLQ